MSVDSNIRDVPVLSIILIPRELAVNFAPAENTRRCVLYHMSCDMTNLPEHSAKHMLSLISVFVVCSTCS